MRKVFLDHAWEDYLHWQNADRAMLRRLNRIFEDCDRSPSAGLGKPEALKGDLAGWWSRRLDGEHRLVYRVAGDDLVIAQCRYHYTR